jgi:plasmid maintenance system antidote protein VapI
VRAAWNTFWPSPSIAPPRRINEIILGKRGVTADTALRLARFFGTSVESWMNVQTRCEVERAHDKLANELASIEPARAAAWVFITLAQRLEENS